MHPGIKLFSLFLFSSSLFLLKVFFLLIPGILLLCGILLSRLKLKNFLNDLPLILFFFILFILSKSLIIPPQKGLLLSVFSLSGLFEGLLIALRYLLLIIAGSLFIQTSSSYQISASLYGLFRRIPFFPADSTALMISFALNFLPLLAREDEEIKQALLYRGFHRQKNPFTRMKLRLLPLLSRALLSIENQALALQARSISTWHPAHFKSKLKSSWILLGLSSLPFFCGIFLIIWENYK